MFDTNDDPACWALFALQVERHRQAAAAAREAAVAREQQVKELSKEGAKADKDRCDAHTCPCGLYPEACISSSM